MPYQSRKAGTIMNEQVKIEDTDIMNIYKKSENILTGIQNIIENSQRWVYCVVDVFLLQRN